MESRPRYGALFTTVRPSLGGLLALLLAWQAQQSEGCSCLRQEFCELTSNMDIVVSGTILDRISSSESSSESTSTDDDDNNDVSEVFPPFSANVVYTVGVIDVYKEDTDLPCGQYLEFNTAASSAACGLNLELNEDYVIGIYVLEDGSLNANLCGPTMAVEVLTAEDIEVLENGGECIDPCANWMCISLQECVVNEDGDPACQYIEGLEPGETSGFEDEFDDDDGDEDEDEFDDDNGDEDVSEDGER